MLSSAGRGHTAAQAPCAAIRPLGSPDFRRAAFAASARFAGRRCLAAVEEAYGMTPKLKPEDVYTDAFLPPAADRRLTVTS